MFKTNFGNQLKEDIEQELQIYLDYNHRSNVLKVIGDDRNLDLERRIREILDQNAIISK